MKRIHQEQKIERRISSALRMALVVILFLAQIALVVLLSYFLEKNIALVYSVLELVAFFVALIIATKREEQTYKYGWVILILTMPVVGLALYGLWGKTESKRLNLANIDYPPESKLNRDFSRTNIERLRKEHPHLGKMALYLDNAGFTLYRGTKTYYLSSGEKYLNDMLEKMEKAEHFIFLEYFIIGTGEIWDKAIDIFKQKCSEGVEIKIIFDDFGSMRRLPYEVISELSSLGVEMLSFNPVHQYVNRLYFNYRDHRKITCIDGDIAYTGGVNVADEYANIITRFGYWKDSGIRIEGEGAWGLTREFIRMWMRMGGSLEREYDFYRPHMLNDGEGFCQTVADGPDNNPVNNAEDVFLQMISNAKSMIYITTPYLAIDDTMMKALCIAGDSNVDVRIILPGIPDHKLIYMVSQSYLGTLMEHHIKIYYYTPGIIHAKTVLVDREAAFVGSVNMDYRSFKLHFECGEVVYNMPCIEGLLEDVNQTIDESHEVTMEEWEHRGIVKKALGNFFKLFAMWF